jgi:RNA polymerase sigma-70 factor (ECF subfamily)
MGLNESPEDLTLLVRKLRSGDVAAAERLWPLVYDELRRLARRAMARQRPYHTLQTTGLLHEAYLKLCSGTLDVQDRAHFLLVAASAMRSVLVDHARARARAKRAPVGERVLLDSLLEAVEQRAHDVIALQEALERLAQRDPRMAKLVDLRFFAGLSVGESAKVLGMSPRQAAREWATARAWLHRELL